MPAKPSLKTHSYELLSPAVPEFPLICTGIRDSILFKELRIWLKQKPHFSIHFLFLEENSQLQQHVITLCGSAFCFYRDKDLYLSMKSSYKELKYVWTLLCCEELEMQTGSWILISLTWHKTKATAFAMRASVQIYLGLAVSRRWSCNFQELVNSAAICGCFSDASSYSFSM